jgi:hypothetical protein
MESFLQNRPSLATAGRFTSQSDSNGDFQPFLRPSLPADKSAALTSTEKQLSSGQVANEPKIELVNREGCIERIVITCSCCQQIELECEY